MCSVVGIGVRIVLKKLVFCFMLVVRLGIISMNVYIIMYLNIVDQNIELMMLCGMFLVVLCVFFDVCVDVLKLVIVQVMSSRLDRNVSGVVCFGYVLLLMLVKLVKVMSWCMLNVMGEQQSNDIISVIVMMKIRYLDKLVILFVILMLCVFSMVCEIVMSVMNVV